MDYMNHIYVSDWRKHNFSDAYYHNLGEVPDRLVVYCKLGENTIGLFQGKPKDCGFLDADAQKVTFTKIPIKNATSEGSFDTVYDYLLADNAYIQVFAEVFTRESLCYYKSSYLLEEIARRMGE